MRKQFTFLVLVILFSSCSEKGIIKYKLGDKYIIENMSSPEAWEYEGVCEGCEIGSTVNFEYDGRTIKDVQKSGGDESVNFTNKHPFWHKQAGNHIYGHIRPKLESSDEGPQRMSYGNEDYSKRMIENYDDKSCTEISSDSQFRVWIKTSELSNFNESECYVIGYLNNKYRDIEIEGRKIALEILTEHPDHR